MRAITLASQCLFALVFVCLGFAQQNKECQDPCSRETPWNAFNGIQLKVTTSGKPGYESLRGTFDNESGDVQINVEISDGTKARQGNILLFGSRVMTVRGSVAEAGDDGDALDAAVLQMRLLVSLLGEVIPGGPDAVRDDRKIDFRNDKAGIEFATPGAQGFIAPPWAVAGVIRRLAPDDFSFSVALTAPSSEPARQNGGRCTASFTGRLFKVKNAKVDDAMPLGGWKVFTMGPIVRKADNGTILDYGATPVENDYKVVSEIRKKIAAEDYPGESDPSKDFTGFWKQDCEDPFGLQIMPYGKDGKYSVTFCGPGGCGRAGEEGKNTFITKDPDYEVISEDKLRIRNALNRWDTYFRCTRDTHPVLKYKD